MASKEKAKAKRISSLLCLNNPNDSKGDVRSFSDPSPGQSPARSSPYLSDLSPSSPSSATLAPQSPFGESRSPSPLRGGRAQSPFSFERRRLRRSRSRAQPPKGSEDGPQFWILSGNAEKVSYDPSALEHSARVPELWDDGDDAVVYICPPSSVKGPSFKVRSSLFSSSYLLASLAHSIQPHPSRRSSLDTAAQNLRTEVPESSSTRLDASQDGNDGPRSSLEIEMPKQEVQLYFPAFFNPNDQTAFADSSDGRPDSEVIEELVSIRNLFAFLAQRPLVASRRYPTVFSVFIRIANFLRDLEFSNHDSSTFGEVPATSFQLYIDTYQLGDVRYSREKTIEALVLGEKMKSFELYNEAFVHAVGKYEALVKLGSPHFSEISRTTRNRMERSLMDLERRIRSVGEQLSNFEFPSLFAGIANSTTSNESKMVDFKTWKASFNALRKHIIGYYKQKLGSWPPKAGGKKHAFEESGLNRTVLRLLYHDMTDLYDLLVDRTAFTSRSKDIPRLEENNKSSNTDEPTSEVLRKMLSEYDRSSPLVQPTIPFDIPKLPSLPPPLPATASHEPFHSPNRKLLPPEIDLLLARSYNADSLKPTPFLTAYQAFEAKGAQHKTLRQISDQRNGYWLFVYAVLQSLPLVVIDAPGLKYSEGVEYFLCEPPKGGLPWCPADSSRRNSWYGLAGGQGMVSLPPDNFDHSVEGVYRRSHCWVMAEQWLDALESADAANDIGHSPPTSPMTGLDVTSPAMMESSSSSPAEYTANRLSTLSLGAEALPVPPGPIDADAEKPADTPRESKRSSRFEDFLPESKMGPKGAKKRWMGGL